MRLTQKSPSGTWFLRGVDLQALQPEVYGALCKLLAYEDTGLDPDEVERMKGDAELLHIGSMIKGYEIIGIYKNNCIARQKYGTGWAVWHLDADLCGVWGGCYFSGNDAQRQAEHAFSDRVFDLRMAAQLKALTCELEGIHEAYDRAMQDLNISGTLAGMIKTKVKEELR